MNISEYKNIYLNESSHFYYVSYHKIIISLIEQYFKSSKKLKILDVGCGTGLFAKKLEKFGEVDAIDYSKEAVKFAQKRGVHAQCASIDKLPFPQNNFDMVVLLDVLYHQSIKDDMRALQEINRILKKDGLIVVKLPAFNFLRTTHDDLVYAKKRYTGQEIENTLYKLNFKNISIFYIGSFLVPIVLFKKILEIFLKPKAHSSVNKTWGPLNQLFIYLFLLENFISRLIKIPFGITFITIAKKG